MSRLSRYSRTKKPAAPKNGIAMAAIGAVMGTALLLALGQLQLKFALKGMDQETSRLQARKLELRSQINLLRSKVEAGKRGDRLIQYARAELGMIDFGTEDIERIVIEPELSERYANLELARAKGPSATTEAGAERLWAEALADRLGIEGRAYADEGSRVAPPKN